MKVTRDDVLHCARLTHLQLTENEIEDLRSSMEKILTRASHLAQLDLSHVDVSTNGIDIPLPVRTDTIEHAFTQVQALANAPEQSQGQFKVPKVL